jgi:hypothetical protein
VLELLGGEVLDALDEALVRLLLLHVLRRRKNDLRKKRLVNNGKYANETETLKEFQVQSSGVFTFKSSEPVKVQHKEIQT